MQKGERTSNSTSRFGKVFPHICLTVIAVFGVKRSAASKHSNSVPVHNARMS